jgi:hypothetical protein
MFDWLGPLLIVILLLIWILDYLGVLEVFGALLELIGAVVAAILRLATWLVRKIAAPKIAASNITASKITVSKPQPDGVRPEPPSLARGRPGYRARSGGSRTPPTD